jgi:hypothetical protein
MESNSDRQITHAEYEQIREVCRENIESLHNLVFLLRQHRAQPDQVDRYTTTIQSHLEKITDALCRKSSEQPGV